METEKEETYLIFWFTGGKDPRLKMKKREFMVYVEMASTADKNGKITLSPMIKKKIMDNCDMCLRTFSYAISGVVKSGLVKKLSAHDFVLNPNYTTSNSSNDRDMLIEEYAKL
jgi:hypothetical protein